MTSNCTEEQAKAINAPVDRPVAIVACPGSGKTFTIIHRVAHLLNSRFRASDLLVITFTRKAARELRNRLSKMSIDSRNLTVLTFHSFGLSILRTFKHLINFREFRIISQKEQMELLESIAKSELRKEILLHLQIYKAQGTCSEELKPIFDRYNATLRKQNSCDFTDLIVLPLEILKRNPEALQYYHRKYKYALVDEMQDVSRVQFELMKVLFGERGCLTVVGDDDQTIYGWRGADAKLLLDFSKVYENSVVINLTRCFRCPPHIVKAMSKVIQENDYRVHKIIHSNADFLPQNNTKSSNLSNNNQSSSNNNITNKTSLKINSSNNINKNNSNAVINSRSHSGKQKKITIYGATSLEDEASLIVSDIKHVIGRGSVAVLFRTRKASLSVKSELTRQNVNAAVSDRARYLESRDVNIILNILQMCAGIPFNESLVDTNSITSIRMYLSAQKAFQAEQDEKEAKEKEDIPKIIGDRKFTGSQKFLDSDSDSDYLNIDVDKLKNNELDQHFLSSDDYESTELIDKMVNDENENNGEPKDTDSDVDYVTKSLKHMKPYDAISIIIRSLNKCSQSTEFLLKEAQEAQENEENNLSDFLYTVRTNTIEETGNSGVHLCTVHQAKGLEWDFVYIIGATKGSWPSFKCDENRLEEERRLFYVAMSRTRKELTISFLNGKGQSNFIDEIPAMLIKEKIHKPVDEELKRKEKQDQKAALPIMDIKFKKVSEMKLFDSQPQFPAQFTSARNLKLLPQSDSQTNTLPKLRYARPQLILAEETVPVPIRKPAKPLF
ncbi:hypothetical protein TRFO_26168 [Tritrichomonas foetus]|uniref:DNA 3'-5' helicase n=1 Tax=Tritrichomonas foetus TaxID=1144522 RepID=A0A1J4K3Y3_9EUKA|nr:hypothetical protein TRFO_26168 [Tritrichomonas foetus]|eukprot:OHT05899.1 hypothetical protein TRFO_26168 [Tritrichomonas foetus]